MWCYAISYDNRLVHMHTGIPRRPSGSESRAVVGIGGGTVDAGGGAAEKAIAHYIRLVCLQSLSQGWLSGSVLGVTIGIGGGIVDKGVGATGRRIN